ALWLVLRQIGRRQSAGGLLGDEPGEQRRNTGRGLDVDRFGRSLIGRDRIERTALTVGVAGLVLRIEPAQHRAGSFVYEVDAAEVPVGIANLKLGQMPVAVGNLEAAAVDDEGAVALACCAVIGAG